MAAEFPSDFIQRAMPPFGPSPNVWSAILAAIAMIAILVPTWAQRKKMGWETATFIFSVVLVGGTGFIIWRLTRNPDGYLGILYVTGLLLQTLASLGLLFGFMEFGVMRLVGMSRLGAIARITYYEALLEPFTLIVLGSGIACIGICARLNFFTYDEDFKMYRDMAYSFVTLFTLPIMVLAATRVIDEEIENRTMLTLMAKPVSRTQVVLGKYLGVVLLIFVCVTALAITAGCCGYLRYFDDMRLDFLAAGTPQELERLQMDNIKAFAALLPSMVLALLQVCCLASISVAISTRFGLAINIASIVVIYMLANLGRYIAGAVELPDPLRYVVVVVTYILPGLGNLDLNQRLVFGDYALTKKDLGYGLPTYGSIWQYVGMACAYAAMYISGILCFAIALFRSRELT